MTWVMIGTLETATKMMSALDEAGFTEQLRVPYQMTPPYHGDELVIFKALKVPSYVDAPLGSIQQVARLNPDEIVLSTNPVSQTTTIVVKEAYFPTWAAQADGTTITVEKETSTGFIQISVPPYTRQVTIYQVSQSNLWNMTTIVSLAICLALTTAFWRKRRSK